MSNGTYIEFLYATILRRIPEAAGKEAHVNALENGRTRLEAFDVFFNSPESRINNPALFSSQSKVHQLAKIGGLYSTQGQVLGASIKCVQIPSNLHRGKEGKVVTDLQEFLATAGFLSLAPSGFYGDKTILAVKEYQAARGIPVTGMVYGMTRAAIESEACGR